MITYLNNSSLICGEIARTLLERVDEMRWDLILSSLASALLYHVTLFFFNRHWAKLQVDSTHPSLPWTKSNRSGGINPLVSSALKPLLFRNHLKSSHGYHFLYVSVSLSKQFLEVSHEFVLKYLLYSIWIFESRFSPIFFSCNFK